MSSWTPSRKAELGSYLLANSPSELKRVMDFFSLARSCALTCTYGSWMSACRPRDSVLAGWDLFRWGPGWRRSLAS